MSEQPDVTFNKLFGAKLPVLLRKLRKKSDWDATEPQSSSEKVFGNESELSLYRVACDQDLWNVAVGLNSRRDSLYETLDLLPFYPEEFDSAGVSLMSTAGETECGCANELHFDFSSLSTTLVTLCQQASSDNRVPVRLSKGIMKEIVSKLPMCSVVTRLHDCGHRTI